MLVEAAECRLTGDSVAVCSQVRTGSIDDRIIENIGSIPEHRLTEVEAALKYSLGLTPI